MGWLGRKLSDAQRAEELFSPYIDGQVTADEQRFLERYLADHPEAREKFELLRAAVNMTRSLPQVKAPRSFVLPRSMARRPALAVRLYPAMRLATVAAMALFIFAVVGDLATTSRLAPVAPLADMVLSRSAAVEATSIPATEAPAAPMAAALTPTAAPTASPAPPAVESALPAETEDGSRASEEAAEPTALAQMTAPAESEPGAQQDATEFALVATPEPEATPAANRADDASKFAEMQVPGAAQVDVLRLTVIGLGAASVILLAATLLLRQRVR
jgi:hypothetical protein